MLKRYEWWRRLTQHLLHLSQLLSVVLDGPRLCPQPLLIECFDSCLQRSNVVRSTVVACDARSHALSPHLAQLGAGGCPFAYRRRTFAAGPGGGREDGLHTNVHVQHRDVRALQRVLGGTKEMGTLMRSNVPRSMIVAAPAEASFDRRTWNRGSNDKVQGRHGSRVVLQLTSVMLGGGGRRGRNGHGKRGQGVESRRQDIPLTRLHSSGGSTPRAISLWRRPPPAPCPVLPRRVAVHAAHLQRLQAASGAAP